MAVGVIVDVDKDVVIVKEEAGTGETGVGFEIAVELPLETGAAICSTTGVGVGEDSVSGEEMFLTLCDFVDSTLECWISKGDCTGKSCSAPFTNI